MSNQAVDKTSNSEGWQSTLWHPTNPAGTTVSALCQNFQCAQSRSLMRL